MLTLTITSHPLDLYPDSSASITLLSAYFDRDRVAQELNGDWVIVINGNLYRCDIENNTRLLRISANDQSTEAENTAIAALIPRSRLYILINPLPDFETVTDENIELYSSDGRNYYGTDSNGAIYRLRKL
jgi:hypothetical protein